MVRKRKATLYILVILIAIWSLVPIYFIFRMSLMYDREIASVPLHFIPEEPTLNNFKRILGFPVNTPYGDLGPSGYSRDVKQGIVNSLFVAIPITLITLAIASPVGYAFGRYAFRAKNGLLFTMLGSRALPPISIVVPYLMLFTVIGLFGTIPGLILITLSITIPIASWILMGFFATLPREIEKAARVDGCSRLGAFRKVILPMAVSGIAAVGVLCFLLSWNEFLYAWLLSAGTPAQTITPVPPKMIFLLIWYSELSSTVVISLIPPIIIALLFERYITKLKIVDPVTYAA